MIKCFVLFLFVLIWFLYHFLLRKLDTLRNDFFLFNDIKMLGLNNIILCKFKPESKWVVL